MSECRDTKDKNEQGSLEQANESAKYFELALMQSS